MNFPVFPTPLHAAIADVVYDHFSKEKLVDTILVVNSCARGQATPESDLDFAILASASAQPGEIKKLEEAWNNFSSFHPLIQQFRNSSKFSHLHLDIISGNYAPLEMEPGGAIDFFEVEIGNQIAYSAPMGNAGKYFMELKKKWLPYYSDELRENRMKMVRYAIQYHLDQIPLLLKRDLNFHAFDTLYKTMQLTLQLLFMKKKVYPIAYNKWIRYQVEELLQQQELYNELAGIIEIGKLDEKVILGKVEIVRRFSEQ